MRIGLFLTYGYGLDNWEESGVLERELSLYEDHFHHGIKTLIVSYGTATDKDLVEKRPYLDLIYNKHNLPTSLYAKMLPSILSKKDYYVDVIKTNQMYGAHVALRCAKRVRKPIVVRQGHSFFESQAGAYPKNEKLIERARRYEARYLQQADLFTFPTLEMAQRASVRHQIDLKRSHLLPNFFVPSAWVPEYNPAVTARTDQVVFFGKLTKQKNLGSLIQAAIGLDLKLVLIGDGPERESLGSLAEELKVEIEFPGRVSHESVKEYLREAMFFVLPSNYEGHPKALIEAMAFGIPVLVTNSVGVAPEVVDGKTGIIVENSVDGLRDGMRQYQKMTHSERIRIGQTGKTSALKRYSLPAVAARERFFLQQITGIVPNSSKRLD